MEGRAGTCSETKPYYHRAEAQEGNRNITFVHVCVAQRQTVNFISITDGIGENPTQHTLFKYDWHGPKIIIFVSATPQPSKNAHQLPVHVLGVCSVDVQVSTYVGVRM